MYKKKISMGHDNDERPIDSSIYSSLLCHELFFFFFIFLYLIRGTNAPCIIGEGLRVIPVFELTQDVISMFYVAEGIRGNVVS